VEVVFGKLAQHDPLFKLTRDMMEYYLERLPPSAKRAVERLFTRCPHEALEFYREIRDAAEEAIKVNHVRNKRA